MNRESRKRMPTQMVQGPQSANGRWVLRRPISKRFDVLTDKGVVTYRIPIRPLLPPRHPGTDTP